MKVAPEFEGLYKFTLYTMTYYCVPTLNMYVRMTHKHNNYYVHVLCSVAEAAIFVRNTTFLNKLHVRRSELRSDNRGTDNRGRTVQSCRPMRIAAY